MSTKEALESALFEDMATLADTLVDDQSAIDLHRALSSAEWHKRESRGRVALDTEEAARLVNRLREMAGAEPLELARPTGDGGVTPTIEYALSSLGWRHDISPAAPRGFSADEPAK
jgi:hypothetical protein